MAHRILTTSLVALSLLSPVAISTQGFARSFGEPCKANEVEDPASLECRPINQSQAEAQGLIIKQKVYATQPVPHDFNGSPDRSETAK